MKIVAIDTSTKQLSVALSDGQQILAEASYVTSLNHATKLMPLLERMMQEVNWSPQDLTRIVIADGPGSYTGLRIGATTAKTLAYTLGIDLVPVSTLELMAASAGATGRILAIQDARRGTGFVGFYEEGQLVGEEQHTVVAEFVKTLPEDTKMTGDTDKFVTELEPFTIVNAAFRSPRAGVLALLGAAREPVETHAFEPRYLRLAEAEAKWIEAQRHD
ncbi:tRNA (adenosine(37)-N6)-threonylcarbamoyltransferase complex dimerization subunit type 1 TsaB [Exiguobacterium sp. RIT594]|uniref:tRNA (adenosine(37)-N6)-threonylcarbamoyltransferase complex dimerization subunit type 1 TsaB n=1 Tax=Exiguobacterium sp. RIT594 TaxID=2282449 RepID=UPI000DF7FCEC|nr:tRNA (adenosine(37)-N6)-threonylcarbamoyltransferase complex dimerization subunit type 1 TsaB [Exiguobacterium sp. RIT594]RDB32175.1 tRNA (adenosine(37)-N6)-threonylcarbamoyltransferase complex dimerization subunit type 1 TsaB [Exiguobacterium sp. RIT594]